MDSQLPGTGGGREGDVPPSAGVEDSATEPASVMLSNGYVSLSIERWPDRKLPTLCHSQGARVSILATFKSEEAADMFARFIFGLDGKALLKSVPTLPKPSEAEGSKSTPSNTTDTQGATDDN